MDNLARKVEQKFTCADYLTWPENERWEIIDGIAYNMSPSPTDIHQEIISQLLTELNLYFREKKCKVYPAPFDLRLPDNKLDEDDKIYDVVQPDIMVVCDSSKISYKGCKGSPDIVIEVLSLSTASHDFVTKKRLYEKNKIKQYWIVNPKTKDIYVYKIQDNGKYGEPEEYKKEDKIKVEDFEGLGIDLKMVFGGLL